MKLSQLIAAAAAVLGLALPLSAEAQGRTQIDTTVRLEGQGTVDLSLISGRIRVTGWDRPDVKISAMADGDARFRFDADSNRVTLTVDSEKGRSRRHGGEARYEVSVPRGTHLILEAVSGNITATGSEGEIEASSVSGDVRADSIGERGGIERERYHFARRNPVTRRSHRDG